MSWSTASVDWWGSRDSNPDAFRHMILNPVCCVPRCALLSLCGGVDWHRRRPLFLATS